MVFLEVLTLTFSQFEWEHITSLLFILLYMLHIFYIRGYKKSIIKKIFKISYSVTMYVNMLFVNHVLW